MKKVFVSISVLALLVTACKKDKDENTAITPTKDNVTGSYRIIKAVASQNGQESDITRMAYNECELDDLHKLNADLTYQIVDQGQTCSTETDGNWEFKSSTSVMIDGVDYTISSFDGDKLMLSVDLGQGAKITETWDKQ